MPTWNAVLHGAQHGVQVTLCAPGHAMQDPQPYMQLHVEAPLQVQPTATEELSVQQLLQRHEQQQYQRLMPTNGFRKKAELLRRQTSIFVALLRLNESAMTGAMVSEHVEGTAALYEMKYFRQTHPASRDGLESGEFQTVLACLPCKTECTKVDNCDRAIMVSESRKEVWSMKV